jgi:hypothetical protein
MNRLFTASVLPNLAMGEAAAHAWSGHDVATFVEASLGLKYVQEGISALWTQAPKVARKVPNRYTRCEKLSIRDITGTTALHKCPFPPGVPMAATL